MARRHRVLNPCAKKSETQSSSEVAHARSHAVAGLSQGSFFSSTNKTSRTAKSYLCTSYSSA